MSDITNKTIVLRLNKQWVPIGYCRVKDAIIALNSRSKDGAVPAKALHIEYEQISENEWNFEKPILIEPVDFKTWITLPVYPYDFVIHTPKLTIKCPTVIINLNYNKIPKKLLRPTKENIYNRDNGKCQYSGTSLTKSSATLDHRLPKSRGGQDTFTNLVLCSKEINLKKGNKTPEEAGLKLLRQPQEPLPIPVSELIKDIKHESWCLFLFK